MFVRPGASFVYAKVITPHDTTINLTGAVAIYVGGAGDITVHQRAVGAGSAPSDGTVLLSAVPAGSILTVGESWDRINSTNTTASLIVGFF